MRLDKATKLFQLPCKSAPEIRNMRTIIQEVGKQCCVVFSVRVCSHFSRDLTEMKYFNTTTTVEIVDERVRLLVERIDMYFSCL